MKNAVIIFGSTTGSTEQVAETVSQNMVDYSVTTVNVTEATAALVADADLVVYGCSTWGYGELQDDFLPYYDDEMTSELLSGKKVAVFGCGDQESFEDVFCEAVELIKTKAQECGAEIVAELKVDGDPGDSEEATVEFAKSL